ncbi:MAG: hypothetical protein KDJ99_25345, partial [Candidatus Competibacteraceae bacterium]|nr:hypothetical protein [Candidatus Competibacteraceae bacterium]
MTKKGKTLKKIQQGTVLLIFLVLALSQGQLAPAYAAGIVVDTTGDVLDANSCAGMAPGDLPGPDNVTSLREAICAANNNPGPDTITLPDLGGSPDLYTLTLTGRGEDGNITGDLDITDTSGALIITGNGASTTIIQAGTTNTNGIDRVFHVRPGATATFENLTIRHGRTDQAAAGSQDDGGGIRIDGGNVTVTNSAITDNAAQGGTSVDGGGIRANAGSTLTIADSTISNNSSSDQGGGIHLDGTTAGGSGSGASTINITNSTISGNSAVDDGGGIASTGTTISLTLNNVTVANNSTGDASAGGGIDLGSGTYSLKNSIVADNTTINMFCGTAPTIGYSIIEGSSGCGTISAPNLTADPGLVALADNGGPTETHALGGGSNAIDSGETVNGGTASGACVGTAGNISVDQRGAPRAQGASAGDSGCDRGAFESSSTVPSATDPEPDNHPTSFSATANSISQITTSWTDAIGTNLPAGYLVLCNTSGTFTDPVDATAQADDTDCSDGSGVQNVAQGTQTAVWTGLDDNTQYFFTIFPFSNSGTDIDYKTDGTPQTANATTLAACVSVTATTFAQFQSAVTDYNANCLDGETLTVDLAGNSIAYATGLTALNNNTTAKLFIKDGTLDANSQGHVLLVLDGDVTFENMLLTGGTGSNGGAIQLEPNTNGTLINTTVTGNTSITAAAILNNGGTLTLTNVTVSTNTISAANNTFGSVWNRINGSTPILNLNNSIIANTVDTNGLVVPDCRNNSGTVNFSPGQSNLIEQDQTGGVACDVAGTNTLSGDPNLGALADNGGLVQTMVLLPGSPAINAGDNAAAAGLSTDARGVGF